MIILFAPAKAMNKQKTYKYQDLEFNSKTKNLVCKLLTLEKNEFINSFNISENLYDEVFGYYNDFHENEGYKAFELFNGEAYKAFDYNSLSSEGKKQLNDKVIIIDALYGIIYPNSIIKPYRLDFHTKGLKLVTYWKEDINNYFSNLDDKDILSLASKEFNSLLTKDKNVVSVKFIDEINGVQKLISVFNKQMRGKLLRYIVDTRINRIQDLPIEIDGYYVFEKTNNEIIYLRKQEN
ncbi:MAG: YaaA family protein [Bacilli bacterium]|nr:YaaA family protein [Bacilli bacterium]